jgi:hypothetical protein
MGGGRSTGAPTVRASSRRRSFGGTTAPWPEAYTEVVTDFLDPHEAFAISRARTVIHP